jgi:hypothetical protein
MTRPTTWPEAVAALAEKGTGVSLPRVYTLEAQKRMASGGASRRLSAMKSTSG